MRHKSELESHAPLEKMHNHKVFTSAIITLLVFLVIGTVSVRANPVETGSVGNATLNTSILSSAINIANTVGNDNFATTDLTAQADPTTTSTQHYGPYASGSTDSGTCGNDWANDQFNRHFTVFQQRNDGSLLVIEQFKDGNFTTPASDSPPVNFSPGGCQNSATPQGIVNGGVTGTLHGYFLIPLPSGTVQTSTSQYCNAVTMTNANCDTTTFVDTHFTPCYGSGVCSATTFFFHYAAGGQGLLINEWKNASTDRGGNSGDIRSSNI